MDAMRDLSGQVFGRLTAIERTNIIYNGSYKWRCRCDCGNEHIATIGNLVNGRVKSCGCLITEINHRIDITGERFGRLVAVSPTLERNRSNHARDRVWECLCDCGNTHRVRLSKLRDGSVKSCGCLVHERSNSLIARQHVNHETTHESLDKIHDSGNTRNHSAVVIADHS